MSKTDYTNFNYEIGFNIITTLKPVQGANLYFNLDTETNQTMRDSPYSELQFYTSIPGTLAIYTSNDGFTSNKLNTSNLSEDLILPDDGSIAYINEKRFYTCDSSVFYADPSIIIEGPEYRYYPYKNAPQFFATFHKKINVVVSKGGPYIIQYPQRTNIWVFFPNKPVFCLVTSEYVFDEKYNFSIFAMQSYSNEVDPSLRIGDLTYLQNKLLDSALVGEYILPKNWAFVVINLNEYLNVPSLGTAVLTKDGLSNSYNYISPYFAKTIYENVKSTLN